MERLILVTIGGDASYSASEIYDWCKYVMGDATYDPVEKCQIVDMFFKYFQNNTCQLNPNNLYFIKRKGADLLLIRDREDRDESKEFIIHYQTHDENGNIIKKAFLQEMSKNDVKLVQSVLDKLCFSADISEFQR